jgi:hypothetical protein
MNVTTRPITFTSLLAATLMVAGCGDTSSGRSPSKVTVTEVKVAAGGSSPTFSFGPLNSDVVTNGTIVDDLAEVTMELQLKDPGVPGTTNKPSGLNAVTFTRYHVDYRRADGRNTPGVDIPYAFDGAVTFTVADDSVTATVELVRHVAKAEAPLAALGADGRNVITSIATVTFYGKDQAGNNVKVSADIQVNFGNFADPT